MQEIQQEIEALLEQLSGFWNRSELSGIRTTEPCYLPEESAEPLIGWEQIEGYWSQTLTIISKLSMRIWDLRLKRLSDDLVVALYQMHWNARVSGYPEPVGGDNRVTAIFRHTSEGWRFCHYVEAPLAPILYMRKLYEDSVDEDFRRS